MSDASDNKGERVELGFQLDAASLNALSESLRGKYDVTRMRMKHPQLVNLITWLLSLPGMSLEAIAEAAGISWESVAAIQAAGIKPIREFKLRTSERLGLILEAALPGLLKRAAEGKMTALEFKLLTESWLQLSGEGHTVKFEGVPQEDPRRQRIRALLDAGSPMVFEAEMIPQSGAAAQVPVPLPLAPSS